MPIVNVNMFQEGINKSEYLTNYTDKYVKQSLANLGQRLSLKGDGIYTGSFQVKELFPLFNNFDLEGLCANFNVTKKGNLFELKSNLSLWKQYVDKITKKPYYKFTSPDTGDSIDAYTFTIDTVNSIIPDVKEAGYSGEDGQSQIVLSNGLQINNTEYWDANLATIIKYDDGYYYKLRASMDGEGTYLEGIFEYVDNNGILKEGIRIISDYGLKESDYDGVERDDVNYYLLYIKRHIDADKSIWYSLNIYFLELQDDLFDTNPTISDKISTIYEYLVGEKNSNLKLDYASSIDTIMNALLSEDALFNIYSLTPNDSDLQIHYEPSYLKVNYDNQVNQYFSIPESEFDRFSKYINENYYKEIYNPTNYLSAKTSKLFDEFDEFKSLIREKLQYFSQDISNLFPCIQEVYNDVKYKDETNLKVYRQIVGDLLISVVYNNLLEQHIKFTDGSQPLTEFNVTLPVDFEITYNVNSNDGSIIYNSINNVSVQYINYTGDITKEITDSEVIDYVNKISNQYAADDTIQNVNTIVAYGYENKTVLYQFAITYLSDLIINQIVWFQSFALPYVNSKGYWNINSVDTDIFAYGRDAQKTNFVVIQSDISNSTYVLDKHSTDPKYVGVIGQVLEDPYNIEEIVTEWEPYPIKMPYLAGPDVIDDTNYYILQSYLPSQNWIDTHFNDTKFSYIENTIFINLMTPATQLQSDLWEIVNTTDNPEYKNVEGYEERWDPEREIFVYDQYDLKAGSLASKIGVKGTLTSFWSIKYNKEENKYFFTYLERPGNTGGALDLTYMCNLDNITKYYISTNLEPDKYEHRWLVFDEQHSLYKNGTELDDEETQYIWPVLMPHNSEFYSGDFGSPDDNPYESNNLKNVAGVFANDLNFGLTFYDNVIKDENNMITYVGQKQDSWYWNIELGFTSYNVPSNPDDYFRFDYENSKEDFLDFSLNKVEWKTYYINSAIPYIRYQNEYIPNSTINKYGERNQWPLFDLSEVFIKDQTTLNRVNIVSVGKDLYQSETIYPLYYSYIGASIDDLGEYKKKIHIGTANANPNIGTKTQTSYENTQNFNKIEEIDIDFGIIKLNGDTEINGNLNINNTVWKTDVIDIGEEEPLTVFSTIITPVGKHKKINVNPLTNLLYPEIATTGAADKGFGSNSTNPNDWNSPEYNATTYSSYQRWNYIDEFSGEINPHVSYFGPEKYNKVPIGTGDYILKDGKYVRSKEDADYVLDTDTRYPRELLFTVEYQLPDEGVNSKATRYYQPRNTDEQYTRISYLNLNKLFADNKIFQNTYLKVNSNAPLTYHTYKENQNTGGVQNFEYKTVYYMQLSTDLTNEENALFTQYTDGVLEKDVKVSNPIQISYYKGPMTVDNYKDETISYLSYLWPTSYTEIWSCPGCSLCSAQYKIEGGSDKTITSTDTCKMIKSCSFSQCKGFVTYEYGRVEENLSSTVKPREFIVERPLKIPVKNGTGETIIRNSTASIYYPNPIIKYLDDTTFYVKDDAEAISYQVPSPGWYYFENNLRMGPYQNTPEGKRPGYRWTGSISFETSYDVTINKYHKAFGNTYYWERDNNKGTYYVYFIDDQAEKQYVTYEYNTLVENETTYSLVDREYDKNGEYKDTEIIKVYGHDNVNKQIKVEYSYMFSIDQQRFDDVIDGITINVREILSTHTTPHIYNGIASVNGLGNKDMNVETSRRGTNKYK